MPSHLPGAANLTDWVRRLTHSNSVSREYRSRSQSAPMAPPSLRPAGSLVCRRRVRNRTAILQEQYSRKRAKPQAVKEVE
jgi:hypothetical protein